MPDDLNPPPAPSRVSYSTGRMLGVEDFQAEQDYHRGRLARALMQLSGTGTISGMLVQTDGNANVGQLEIQVTAGVAIDRVGRIVEVPRMVCIVLNDWLTQYTQAWQAQLAGQSPGTTAIADPNTAIHNGNLTIDVFATFVSCTQGVTPCFASADDYDATDAFSANRLLDSFAMQLVLRTDANPKTPLDPWAGLGANQPPLATIQQSILSGALAPQGAPVEYPPAFTDLTGVFLARILVPATQGASGQPPAWNLTGFGNGNIDNSKRLFVIPSSILARWNGLGSGTES